MRFHLIAHRALVRAWTSRFACGHQRAVQANSWYSRIHRASSRVVDAAVGCAPRD